MSSPRPGVPSALDEGALVAAARAAAAGAYAPYSGFRVGAVVLTADGRTFSGANVENAAYPAGLCAEQAAVAAAVNAGARALVAVAVAGDGPGPCPPCGMCRQFLYEFAPDLVVLGSGSDGAVRRWVLSADLLPEGFGPTRLAEGTEPP